ncbi:Radical SAM [Sulfurimonas denitrificans DSM 1251]|jgi:radical SAM superfamily enzyme YgiQ (UPF0313 family)|uniref:Radical SAM n=1 Tax=Sulfurimonas denitrificans (strain ATCC 33889 / DSM 1251) TaxID=326298 RepID=Q30UK8_SULDN|nr:B12-binding domain-containing radical SAM protein [Sulfurimonas denitrificans]ABB43323.1 Radical SAM [Sulfurimonas denitrificans DSM 1251]MDD3442325.1 DUF4080 domain-containing protein [Sulfurimonas denitrificans]
MKKIILTTLNSRFTHTSIALRYLFANLAQLQSDALIQEFTINDAVQSIAQKLLFHNPQIIGIGVYIWNVKEVYELIHIIKKVSPATKIILGGPEVSHEPFRVNLDLADFIIQGEGDIAFYELCKNILSSNEPREKVIKMSMPSLKNITLPYRYYSDDDIKNRYIYVEASRGCPFECEFCLSSMDEKVRAFDIDKLLEEFELLWQRGARNFKFIDRTFNLNIKTATILLDFFLNKDLNEPYFAHFEVVPDHFPQSLKSKIASFKDGALQLEIGIQTLNPQIAKNISRVLNLEKIKENILFLENETHAHIHLDLIVGLPGESLESFGKNLDELVSLSGCEIQIGILKKLSGTYINRHDIEHKMIYSDIPPYDVLQTSELSFTQIGIMKRFSRFWDLTYNSGNFKQSVKLIWQDGKIFESFYDFSLWIYEQTDSTWQISLQRLGELLFKYLCEVKKLSPEFVANIMIDDMMRLQGRVVPPYLKQYTSNISPSAKKGTSGFNKRQH